MEFFKLRRTIPFMRHALVFNVVSLITFLAAVAFLATRGLHLSIEFTGGTVMEVSYPQAPDLGLQLQLHAIAAIGERREIHRQCSRTRRIRTSASAFPHTTSPRWPTQPR